MFPVSPSVRNEDGTLVAEGAVNEEATQDAEVRAFARFREIDMEMKRELMEMTD